MKNPLLVFAHKKEAAAFFLHIPYIKFRESGLRLYKSSRHFLLISGEGYEKAEFSLNSALDYLSGEVSAVINLGVSGSLDPESASLGKIYPIKNILREDHRFSIGKNTFTTGNSKGLRCVSSFASVMSSLRAEKLRLVADVVDCEAWGLGRALSQRELKFHVFKLISDYPGLNNREEILKRSDIYSESLYRHYVEET